MIPKKSKLRILYGALLAIVLIFVVALCFSKFHKRKGISLEVVEVKANPAENLEEGYGYRIYVNDTLLIYQPFIPSVPGKQPFKTKDEAFKVGELVVHHMQTYGDFFVSKDDLKKIGVIQ
jgi:hypothetical protein